MSIANYYNDDRFSILHATAAIESWWTVFNYYYTEITRKQDVTQAAKSEESESDSNGDRVWLVTQFTSIDKH